MKRKGIAALRHRLVLCTQSDVITEDGVFVLNREEVQNFWASIAEKSKSRFSAQGAAIDERNKQTHEIKIRYQPFLNVSTYAWLYEARMKSSPRWFKILSVGQTEEHGTEYYKFSCRIVERADDTPTPAKSNSPTVGLPEGLKL